MNKINWVKVMEDNRDAIEETIREAKKETYETMQGWHVDVEIDKNGKAWTGDLLSTGSQSMSSYNGETFIVCGIQSWEVDCNEQEDIKYDEKLNAEYLAQKDDEDGYEYAWEFMENKYPEIRKQWQQDAIDFEISEFDPRELLDRAIENERAYRQYE